MLGRRATTGSLSAADERKTQGLTPQTRSDDEPASSRSAERSACCARVTARACRCQTRPVCVQDVPSMTTAAADSHGCHGGCRGSPRLHTPPRIAIDPGRRASTSSRSSASSGATGGGATGGATSGADATSIFITSLPLPSPPTAAAAAAAAPPSAPARARALAARDAAAPLVTALAAFDDRAARAIAVALPLPPPPTVAAARAARARL